MSRKKSAPKPFTVGALKKALAGVDDDKIVVLSPESDEAPLALLHSISTTNFSFNPKTREIGLTELTNAAISLGHTEDQVCSGGKPAIILYPA